MANEKIESVGIKTWQVVLIAVLTALVTLGLTLLSRATTGFAARGDRMSFALLIHLATVLPAVPLGGYLLFRRKGDRLHRGLGRLWAGLMMITAIATLWLTGPDGGFSFIHIFSIITLISVPRAVLAIRRGDIKTHRYAVVGSYIGLVVAGAFAFSPGRLLHDWTFG